jgi:hypothetical protein
MVSQYLAHGLRLEDATHVDQLNTRRMLKYVVAHSDGALR